MLYENVIFPYLICNFRIRYLEMKHFLKLNILISHFFFVNGGKKQGTNYILPRVPHSSLMEGGEKDKFSCEYVIRIFLSLLTT